MNHVAFMRKAKEQLSGNWLMAAVGALIVLAILTVASGTYVLELVLAGPFLYGFVLFITNLILTRQPVLELIFKGFDRFAETCVAGLLYSLGVSIGTALLIVPGIICATGFGFAFFIMADEPGISGVDALAKSWQMTKGYKWDIFCFGLRFIGWALLSVLTCGLGFLLLYPYMTASYLNYYRNLRYGTF